AALPQPPAELSQHVLTVPLPSDGEHRRDDLESESRRSLERVQIERQRTGEIARLLRDPGGQHVCARELRLVGTRLAQQRARPRGIALQQCMLGELTQVMRRDARALALYRLRQLVK